MAYWLVKSGILGAGQRDQQVAMGAKGEAWTGVRNFTARRDPVKMKKGDRAFFYHSNEGKEIVGIAEIIREAYPDPSDKTGKFVCVDLKADKPLKTAVTMAAIKADKRLADMALVKYSRLSVQPVTAEEWKIVCKMGGVLSKTVGWAKALSRRAHHLRSWCVLMVGTLRFAHPTLLQKGVRGWMRGPSPRMTALRRRGRHYLGQQLLAFRLRTVALHGRGETFEDAVLEGGDDGIVDVALATNRRRVRQFIRSRAYGFQHLLAATAARWRPRTVRDSDSSTTARVPSTCGNPSAKS